MSFKYLETSTEFGFEMKVYKEGALTVLESTDDLTEIVQMRYNFGTDKMPLGKYKHVSVSRQDRYPTWDEIKKVKEEFFGDSFVFQVLPPKSHYVNIHNYCFHLWQIL